MILFQILEEKQEKCGHCAYCDYGCYKEAIKRNRQCAAPNCLNCAEPHHLSETSSQGCDDGNWLIECHSFVKVGRDGIDEVDQATVKDQHYHRVDNGDDVFGTIIAFPVFLALTLPCLNDEQWQGEHVT